MLQSTYDTGIPRKNRPGISFRIAHSPYCFILWNSISVAFQLQYKSAAQDISTRLHSACSDASILPEAQYTPAESCDIHKIKDYFIVECYTSALAELALVELEVIDFEHIHTIDYAET